MKKFILFLLVIMVMLATVSCGGILNASPETDKLTKLHFYMHDFIAGPNQSVYNVAESSITRESPTWFGRVQVADHLLTMEPEIGSEKVGRLQGTHALSDLDVPAITVNWNFLFNDGSTITVLGRLVAFAKQGSSPLSGGTGKYLLASGYALKNTVFSDPQTHHTIFEYTLYVYSSGTETLLGLV